MSSKGLLLFAHGARDPAWAEPIQRVANAIAAALAGQAARAGAASAMVGAIQYGCGIAGTLAVSLLADGTPRALGFVMIASPLAVATFGLLAPRR